MNRSSVVVVAVLAGFISLAGAILVCADEPRPHGGMEQSARAPVTSPPVTQPVAIDPRPAPLPPLPIAVAEPLSTPQKPISVWASQPRGHRTAMAQPESRARTHTRASTPHAHKKLAPKHAKNAASKRPAKHAAKKKP